MGILLQRAKIVSLKDKRQIQARLDMYDDLFENNPKIKKIRAESKERGKTEGQTMALRRAVVNIVQKRFPVLVELARKRTSHISKLAALDNLVLDISDAPDEAAARALLEATEQKRSASKQS